MKTLLKTVLVAAAMFMGSIPAAFASITATISVNSQAILSSDRIQVIVSGTYTCGPLPQPQPTLGATFAFADFSLSQAAGRDVAQALGGFAALCDGLPQVFQAPIFATTIPWHGGKARLVGSLYVQLCDEFFNCEFANASINTAVRISGGPQ